MKNTIKTLVFGIVLTLLISSFVNMDPKKEIHYKDIANIETEHFILKFSDMHSQSNFTMMKISVENITDGYLIVDRSKMSFYYPGNNKTLFSKNNVSIMGGGELYNNGGAFIIPPKKAKNVIVKVTDPGGWMQVDSIQFNLGGFTYLKPTGEATKFERMTLPPVKKVVESDKLNLSLLKEERETKQSKIVVLAENTSENYYRFNSEKVVFAKEDDSESINYARKKTYLLKPEGQKKFTFIARIGRDKKTAFDMQFSKFYLDFKDAFEQLETIELNVSNKLDLVIDEEKTKNEN